jgi:hypothetical protein
MRSFLKFAAHIWSTKAHSALVSVVLMSVCCTSVRGKALEQKCCDLIGHPGRRPCELGVAREWRKLMPGFLKGLFLDRYRPKSRRFMEPSQPLYLDPDFESTVLYAWQYHEFRQSNHAVAEFFLKKVLLSYNRIFPSDSSASKNKECEMRLFLILLLMETTGDSYRSTVDATAMRGILEEHLRKAHQRCAGSNHRAYIDLARNEYLLFAGKCRMSCAILARSRRDDPAALKCYFALQSSCCARGRGLIVPVTGPATTR